MEYEEPFEVRTYLFTYLRTRAGISGPPQSPLPPHVAPLPPGQLMFYFDLLRSDGTTETITMSRDEAMKLLGGIVSTSAQHKDRVGVKLDEFIREQSSRKWSD